MSIREFIQTLEQSNFSLIAEDGKLILKGNKDKLTAEEIESIKKNEQIITYIREKKEELIAYVSSSKLSFRKRSDNVLSIYRLSPLQEGMLFHGLYSEKEGTYTEQLKCLLRHVNADAFEKSCQYLLSRHSILRSGFYYDAFKIPVQCVYRDVAMPLEILDYRHLDAEEQKRAVKDYEDADKQRGFDFRKAPLMRIALIRLSQERYCMIWSWHHIMLDGWSMAVLMENFLSIYEALLAGQEPELPEEDRFEDYIRYLERRDKEQEQRYWVEYMKGIENDTLLPFISATTERTKGVGVYRDEELKLNRQMAKKIERYAQRHRLTVNTVIQGVWAYLLHAYTGNHNVAYGVIVSGRPNELPGVERRIGLYINTIPLHAFIEGEQRITDWLQAIQSGQVLCRQHQYASLRDIQEWIGLRGDLFDTTITFQNYPLGDVVSAKPWSLQMEDIEMFPHTNYPLSILVVALEEISITFSYNSSLLKEDYIKRIALHFDHVLQQFIGEAVETLNDIKIVTSDERKQLLSFGQSSVDYPRDKTVVDLFEEQAMLTPGAPALAFEGHELSYRELDERANQLAHYLQKRGLREGSLAAICMERGIEMLTALLGILKAGAAYVPVEPDQPEERIAHILHDAGVQLVVSSSTASAGIAGYEGIVLELDTDRVLMGLEPTG
ncbi:MAG TPA: condensation domain-containing protein, partial [Chitinophagaceae bacterium]|nr:condensation domain-containing protein [Chitinophagaceae bacterium]